MSLPRRIDSVQSMSGCLTRRTAVLASLLGAAAGCRGTSEDPRNEDVIRYDLRGVVVSVDREQKTALIRHEEIKNFMEAMTMEFPVRDDRGLERLQAGNRIRATLCQRPSDFRYWIEDIHVLKPDSERPSSDARQR